MRRVPRGSWNRINPNSSGGGMAGTMSTVDDEPERTKVLETTVPLETTEDGLPAPPAWRWWSCRRRTAVVSCRCGTMRGGGWATSSWPVTRSSAARSRSRRFRSGMPTSPDPGAVRPRGRDHGPPRASRHRAGLRAGPVARGAALLRDAVHPGREPRPRHRQVPRGRRPRPRPGRAGAGAGSTCSAASSPPATRSTSHTAGASCIAT